MWPAPASHAAPGVLGAEQGSLFWMHHGQNDVPQSGQQQEQATGALPAVVPSLQASPLPAVGLDGLPHLNGALLDVLPPLPTSDSRGDAASACPADSSGAKPVDKKAIAREKNRLAQQRFREKERAKLAEAEEEADALRGQLQQLRLENERLQLEHTLLEKLLAVRNAIASVVIHLDALPLQEQQGAEQAQQGQQGAQQQPQQQAQGQGPHAAGSAPTVATAAGLSAVVLLQDPSALRAASQQLAAALGELPSLEQVEQLVVQRGVDSGPGPAGGQPGSSSSGRSSGSNNGSISAGGSSGPAGLEGLGFRAATAAGGGGAAAAPLPPISATAGAAAASGLAVEQSRLREVAPLPCPTAQQVVESIEHVESLLEEWRQWRLGLRQLFSEAQARRFADQEQVDALAAHMRSFVEVFWAACHVRPQLFNLFLLRSLPPPGTDWSGQWARIAQESLPLVSDSDVAVFRQAMQQYTKRVALAAVGVQPWVQRLQGLVAAQRSGVAGMNQWAAQHSQVCEVASRLHYACTEHYLAYMGLLSEVSAHASAVLRALWHCSSDPFAPDHPAIVSQILRLHRQQQPPRQQLAASQAPPAPQAQQAQQAAPEAQQAAAQWESAAGLGA